MLVSRKNGEQQINLLEQHPREFERENGERRERVRGKRKQAEDCKVIFAHKLALNCISLMLPSTLRMTGKGSSYRNM